MRKIAFVIDPIEGLHPEKDSSLLLMRAAQRLGLEVFYAAADSVLARNSEVRALWKKFDNQSSAAQELSFNEFSVVFLREEPPLDQDYIELTYLYELASKPLFINTPAALRRASEKLLPLHFQKYIPDQIITRSRAAIEAFLREKKEIILKPIGLFGSAGVQKLRDGEPGAAETIDAVTQNGERLIVCQEFLKNVSRGDKRVFFIHGEISGYFNSIPAADDFRGNSHFGATFAKTELSAAEKKICLELGDFFRRENLYFVGVDFVDEKITEINVSCVGGIWNMNYLYSITYEDTVLKELLKI